MLSACSDEENASSSSNQIKSDTKFTLFNYTDQDLAEARTAFQTKIIDTSFTPDGTPANPPEDVFKLIHYPAPAGDMAAYLTPNPNDGEKHPAVIWLIGGYGGIGNDDFFWEDQHASNDQTAAAFRKAGIVLMIPSFRGENDNPGQYEMFYGEMDDLAAARNYLASQPYVDPNRIYLAGHSTGGTRVLLGNEMITGFRAAFSIGGIPDLEMRLMGPMRVEIPFDKNNPEELRLRSPATFIRSIKSPTYYFEGAEDWWPEFDEVQNYAKQYNIPFYTYKINNADHFNIIAPVNELIAQKILTDTESMPHIDFTKEELNSISQKLQ